MKKLVSTLNLSKTEWLQYRKRGIGGSDAGAVCGLNPYVSVMDVYLDKINADIVEEKDNEAMKQGRDLEDYVARRFTEETGLKVRKSNAMYMSREHPFMLADVDRLLVGQNAGLECKTASPYSADKWKDGKVPAHYLAQCYHYMAVLGADAWYSIYYTAQEVAQMLGISRGHAYKIVKNLNVELQQQGYITIAGRVPKKYLREHYYGLTIEQEAEMLAN